MGNPTFKTLDEANEALAAKKTSVKEAKGKLTTYYKENGLKRNEDYTKDKTHAKPIEKLESRISKRSSELEGIIASIETLGGKPTEDGKAVKGKGKDKKSPREPKASGNLKYEYPADITTPDARKKYRIEQRKLAAGGDDKPKAEKTKKKAKEEAPAEDKPATKKGGKKKTIVKNVTTTKKPGTKPKKEVATEDDGDDD